MKTQISYKKYYLLCYLILLAIPTHTLPALAKQALGLLTAAQSGKNSKMRYIRLEALQRPNKKHTIHRGDPLPRNISAVGLITTYDTVQEATSLATASTLVKRDSNANATVNGLVAVTAALKSNNANTITLQAPTNLDPAYTLTLPTTAGTNGYVLATNGSGTLSWASVPTTANTIVQGGNALGATITIGSNDAYDVKIKTNNTDRISISSAGTTTIAGSVVISDSIEGNASNILNIGTSASSAIINIGTGGTTNTINIGGSGDTINLYGTTNYNQVTDLQIADKNITLNKGGAAASAGSAGLDIEEDSQTTGYLRIKSDRTAIELKAPATAGVVTITPGASGFSINQGVATGDSPTFASPIFTTQLWIKGGNGDVGPLLYQKFEGHDHAVFAFNRDINSVKSNAGYGQAVLELAGNGVGNVRMALTDTDAEADLTLVERFYLDKNTCTIVTNRLELPDNCQIYAGGSADANRIFHQYNGATNIFVGRGAGNRTLTENGNTGIGNTALSSLIGGYRNTATGYQALKAATNAYGNTAIGAGALQANTTGLENTAIGDAALQTNTTASYSTAIGTSALKNVNATENVAIGSSSLTALTTGEKNTAIGNGTLLGLSGGSTNVAIGYLAGSSVTGTGSNNIIIGAYQRGGAGDSGVIRIGEPSTTSSCYIGGIYNNTEPAATYRNIVYATDSHQLGTNSATGTITAQGGLNTTGSFSVNTNKMTVNASTGALSVAGTFTINTNKFSVASDTGNTTIAGTLSMPAQGQILFDGTRILHEAYDTSNIFVGRSSGNRTLTGTNNAALGSTALSSATSGYANTAVGAASLAACTTGYENTAVGQAALGTNSIGNYNTAVGYRALAVATEASENTACGQTSLAVLTTGVKNCALGNGTLNALKTGSNNTAIGYLTGSALTGAESNTILIGSGQIGAAGESNVIRIGVPSTTTSCYIDGIYNAAQADRATRKLVYVTDYHQLATASSTGTVTTDGNVEIKSLGYAVVSPQSSAATPRTLYGYIDSTGTKQSGSDGWTVSRVNVGRYTISFTTSFTNIPSVCANAFSTTGDNLRYDVYLKNLSTSSVSIYILDPTVNWYDQHFCFQAMGV